MEIFPFIVIICLRIRKKKSFHFLATDRTHSEIPGLKYYITPKKQEECLECHLPQIILIEMILEIRQMSTKHDKTCNELAAPGVNKLLRSCLFQKQLLLRREVG